MDHPPIINNASSAPHHKPGYVSPHRARTMKEYDQEIAELNKENFNLKLRLYFLEEKMEKVVGADNVELFKMNVQLGVEVQVLKKELEQKEALLAALEQHRSQQPGSEAFEEMVKENQTLYNYIKERDEEVDKLEKALVKAQAELEAYNDSLIAVRKETALLKAQLESKAQSLSEEQEKSIKLQSSLQEKDERLSTSEKSQKELLQQLEEMKKKLSKRNKIIQGLSQHLNHQDGGDQTSLSAGNLTESAALSNFITLPPKDLLEKLATFFTPEEVNNRIISLSEALNLQTKSKVFNEMEQECKNLHKALAEKDRFVKELLEERDKIRLENEKSVKGFFLAHQQAQDYIKTLEKKLASQKALQTSRDLSQSHNSSFKLSDFFEQWLAEQGLSKIEDCSNDLIENSNLITKLCEKGEFLSKGEKILTLLLEKQKQIVNSKSQENKDLNSLLKAKEKQLQDLQVQVDKVQEENVSLGNSFPNQEQTAAPFDQNLNKFDDLQNIIKEKEALIRNLEKELESKTLSKDSQSDALFEQLVESQNTIEMLTEEIHQKEAHLNDLKSQYEASKKQVESQSLRFREVEKIVKNLESQNAETNSYAETLHQQLEDKREEVDKLLLRLREFKIEMAKEQQQHQQEVSELKALLDAKQSELEIKHATLKEANAHNKIPLSDSLDSNKKQSIKSPPFTNSDFGHSDDVVQLKEEIEVLLKTLEKKEKQLLELAAQDNLNYSLISHIQDINTLQQKLAQSKQSSELLQQRLEELADFLEDLLESKDLLDMSGISNTSVSRLKKCLSESRQLSQNISRQLIASEANSIFGLENTALLGETSLLNLTQYKGHELLEPRQSFSLPVEQPFSPPTRDCQSLSPESSKIKSKCSQMKPISSLQPFVPDGSASDRIIILEGSDSESLMLLLNEQGLPKDVLIRKNEVVPLKDKMPPQQPASISSSDSDIWSEPDRTLSMQRLGLSLTPPPLPSSPTKRNRRGSRASSGHRIYNLETQLHNLQDLYSRCQALLTQLAAKSDYKESAEIEFLKDQLRQKSEEHQVIMEEKMELEKELSEFQFELSSSRKLLEELKHQLEEKENHYQLLVQDKMHLEEDRKSLLQLSQDMQELKHLLSEEQTKVSREVELRKEVESQLHEKNKENKNIQDWNLRLQKEIANKEQKYAEIIAQSEETARLFSKIEKENEAKNNLIKHLELELKNATSLLEQMKEDLMKKDNILFNLGNKAKLYEEQVANFQKKIIERDTKLEELDSNLKAKESQIMQFETEINEKNKKYLELAHKFKEIEVGYTKLQEEYRNKEMAILNYESKLAELNREIKSVFDDLTALKGENLGLRKQVARIPTLERENYLLREQGQSHSLSLHLESNDNSLLSSSQLLDVSILSNKNKILEEKLSHFQHQLEASHNLKKFLELEVQIYQKLQDTTLTLHPNVVPADSLPNTLLSDVLKEMQHLRKEFTKSIQINKRLWKKLEQAAKKANTSDFSSEVVSSSSNIASDERSFAPDMLPSSPHDKQPAALPASPGNGDQDLSDVDTLPTRGTPQKKAHPPTVSLALNVSSQHVPLEPSYSSPDLGIESDTGLPIASSLTPYSENKSQPSIYKTPPSPSQGSRLCAVSHLHHYELLKREIAESHTLVHNLETQIQERIRAGPSPIEYTLLKEIEHACASLTVCLRQGQQIVSGFWFLPSSSSTGASVSSGSSHLPSDVDVLLKEKEDLERELNSTKSLTESLKKQLQEALDKLTVEQSKKANREHEISKQLLKTRKVLKQAKGNLEPK